MLSLLTLTIVAASPSTGLVLSAQIGREVTPSAMYLDAIEKELTASSLTMRRLTLSCDGKRECLLAGAVNAGVAALVAVTVASTKKQATIDLEALRTSDGTTVSQLTFAVKGRISEADRTALRKFGAALAEAIAVKADIPVVEAPPPVLTPVERPPELVVTGPALAPSRSSVPGWVMGGGAVACAVTSGVFVGLASSTRATLEATPDPSPLTRAAAGRMAADSNREYSVALATGLAAGALATGALVWLLTQ